MTRLTHAPVAGLLCLLFTLFIFSQCTDSSDAESSEPLPAEITAEFGTYISAHSAGVISRTSNIRVRFTENVGKEGQSVDKDVFRFEPAIKGFARWADSRTIEFIPESHLPSGSEYQGAFYLSKVMDVPENLEAFSFKFQTKVQDINVSAGQIQSYRNKDMTWNKITGSVYTADWVDDAVLEKMVHARQDDKSLKMTWTHSTSGTAHSFTIDSVQRTKNLSKVLLTWDGAGAGISEKGKQEVEVPGMGEFKLMEITVINTPEQYIVLEFSDPLMRNQNLDGLIRLENGRGLNFTIEGNKVLAYPRSRLSGNTRVLVSQAVKNSMSYSLGEDKSTEIAFQEVKPQIRLVGNGVILPSSNGLIFPFEAINLRAVDVQVVKIFANNVGQFLQDNNLDGQYYLRKVGRPIIRKTVPLTTEGIVDRGTWNSYSIDLSDLIKSDPGAIYNVQLSFKMAHSTYPCENGEPPVSDEDMELVEEGWDGEELAELTNWDNYYDGYYYSYQHRDDPCHEAYYSANYARNGRWVNRNVLASDLGLIVKRGGNKTLKVAVTDLVSASPQSGVKVMIYDYQNQLIKSGTTDGAGFANLEVKGVPYLIVAKKDKQKGYMRLDDGMSLSLSKFDVWGSRIQKGLKGYLYGERGVWRPGDSLYLNFILEDELGKLPEKHPVAFELLNPQGQIKYSTVSTKGINGFYDFRTKTEEDDPTGNWMAKVTVGGVSFSKTVKVETVKPNRLKIYLDFGVEQLSANDNEVKGDLEVKWLHGADARNLKADITAVLRPANTSFDKYTEYEFDDPVRNFSPEYVTLFEGKVNDEGKAKVTTDIKINDEAPGMLKAHFQCRVFEESGDFSVDQFSIPYAPYESFVGVKLPKGDKARNMLLTDAPHDVEIITVDGDGEPIARKGLEVEFYKVNWRWWWDGSSDNFGNYVGSNSSNLLDSKTISTNANGEGTYKLRVDYPDWGRYLVRVCDPESGHCTGKTVYIDWPGWAGRAQRENPGGASMLTFSLDKDKYQVGEIAEITIPTSGVGRALVSIESGSEVVKAFWAKADEDQTKVKVRITKDMAPNVYANVTLVQPHANTKNDLPIRLYGVMPIMVSDPNTKLEPQLDVPEVFEPESTAKIKVKEANGKAMTYTVAIVDEGLLDLTRFKTPDPHSSFYARQALGVKTWDLYEMVIGAYGGKMGQLLSIGGGAEDEADSGTKKAKRFKPMVRYLGPFELKAGKTATHEIQILNYIGSVRTMIVAGDNGSYGSADVTTPVKKPLMVLATLPRVVGPGEKVKLPVTVFAMEDNIKNVEVDISTNGLLKIDGQALKTMKFERMGDQIIEFDLEAVKKLGIAKVDIKVKSGSETASYQVELDVRNPNPRVVEFEEAIIEPGKTWEMTYDPVGMEGTNEGKLELSNLPPIDFGRRLKYLIRYPHGCVEQTTSAAFPQLFVGDVIDMEAKAKNTLNNNVRAGLDRLRSFQNADGGLAYWPGNDGSDDWGTSYAGHFMLEAEKKGFALPSGMKSSWLKYQSKVARNWSPSGSNNNNYSYRDFNQAYRLYTLALAGKAELGAMNLLREQPKLSLQARWRLAAAYALVGQTEVAKELVSGVGYNVPEYSSFNASYGSSTRDQAMILETMVLMGEKGEAFKLLKEVSDALSGQRWMSTQTTAYSLVAVSKYAGNSGTDKKMGFEYSINGSSMKATDSYLPVSQKDLIIVGTEKGKVKVKNTGSGVIYARVTLEGIPETGNPVSSSNGVGMSVRYTDMAGQVIDVTKLEQGTDFLAQVTLRNTNSSKRYTEMALTQIFPSGWEIHNSRMSGMPGIAQGSKPDYQDFRDDRVLSYFNINANESQTYVVQLNAAYLGKFYLPTVYCEAMYDNTVNARQAGRWVSVVNPE